ncbi:MAG TPA: tRNA 2-thiouridine(34) synthase MnmA, partial [Candidatus Aminicenantes bacterium]|nr:tRNA 2-thiouridine(34) synthase MnmA [Candidatus Aminicenantes bacterium]
KDQSYFLYRLGQYQLSRTLMPVGDLTKRQVREKARALGFPAAGATESQEICFVPGNDYPRFLESQVPEAFKPGPILDAHGRILGEHGGILHFTVGQRRGMRIAAANPLYVLSIDPAANSIVIGPDEELYRKALTASRLNYVSADAFETPTAVKAKIRYKHAEAEALVIPEGTGKVLVEFEKAQRAITPGQAVVFYDGDTVLGGGTIDSVSGS